MSYRRRLMGVELEKFEELDSYLTLDILSNGNTGISVVGSFSSIDYIAYSVNNRRWKKWTNPGNLSKRETIVIPVRAGDKVRFRGEGSFQKSATSYLLCIGSGVPNQVSFNVYGSILSLMGRNSTDTSSIPTGSFSLLFENSPVKDASGLILPVIASTGCYLSMFKGSSITKSPNLAHIQMKSQVFQQMFFSCKDLISVPDTLQNVDQVSGFAYYQMFYGCTSIIKAPYLPATRVSKTTLSYSAMFSGCSKLSYIKSMILDVSGGTGDWVKNVASNGIFIKNINATWTNTGSDSAPTGWTILYYDKTTDKYYLDDKTTECDDHGNVIN